MRSLFVGIAVAALGASLAWWAFGGEDVTPPAPVALDAAPTGVAQDPVTEPRAPMASARQPAAQAPATDPPAAPSQQVDAAAEAAAAPPAVLAKVTNLTTRATVAPFRWSFRTARETLRGEAATSPSPLPLPRGTEGLLLIEADQHQPYRVEELRVPQPGAPALLLDCALLPAVERAGVTLVVTGPDAQPIDGVRVDAFELDDQNRDAAWQLGAPLWSRRASSPDGLFELPPLPVGEFGVQLVAVDGEGRPRPLTAWRGAFALTGSNGFVDHVSLEPACALTLDLQDAQGAAFDPRPHGAVQLELTRPATPGLQRRWVAAATEGAGQVTAVDALPAPAPVWLAAPVAPGAYQLEIKIGGAVRAQRTLLLRAEAQTEQVVVY